MSVLKEIMRYCLVCGDDLAGTPRYDERFCSMGCKYQHTQYICKEEREQLKVLLFYLMEIIAGSPSSGMTINVHMDEWYKFQLDYKKFLKKFEEIHDS